MSAAKNEDPTLSLLLLIGLLGVFCWLIWHLFSVQLLEFLRYLRLVELAPAAFFDQSAMNCMGWLRSASVGNDAPTREVLQHAVSCYGIDTLRSLNPTQALKLYNVTPTSMGVMMTLATRPFRWLAVVVCAGIFYYSGYVTPRNRFKSRHTLESFIQAQVKMWPVISPIVHFHPSKASARVPGDAMPDRLPPFAEAMSPEEWLSWHRIPVVSGVPNKERTRRAFLEQLGPRWHGPEGMPKHMECLFAAFALQGVQKREQCENLLGRLALHWSEKGGFQPTHELMAEVRKIIRDPKIGGKAAEVAARYAYRTTAFLGILKWARFMGGVLAPAQFLWLRAEERGFWYPLNNLGRRSFHSEGAGAIAHFMAEEAAGSPLPMPRIDTAIITLNQYLANHPDVKIPPRQEPRPKKAVATRS